MTAPVFNENDWCLVEWTDFTRTVVHSSEVVDLEGQISGSTVFIKNGDDLLRSSLVERNTDRKHLESQITAKAKGRPKRNTKAPAIVDIVDEVDEADENADPYDFEPSATDWAPSDENLSDSEFEVEDESKRRKISLSNTNCRKRQCKSTKNALPSSSTPNINVLTPSNKPNNVLTPSNTNQANTGGRRNARKQAAPKQFISPPKEEPIYVPLPRKQIITANGRRIHILPNSTRPVVPNNTKQGTPNGTKQIAPIFTKQNAPNCTKQIAPNGRNNNNQGLPNENKQVPTNGRNNNLRKRKYPATKNNAAKQNTPKANVRTPNGTKTNRQTPKANKTNTPTQNVNKTNTATPNANKTITPKDTATTSKAIKDEQNGTIKPAEENIPVQKPETSNDMPNTLDKPTVTEPENAGPMAENQNAANENVTENSGNVLDTDKNESDKVKKQPEMINIIIDVKTYSKFRRAFRKIHNTYDKALKSIPMKKEKKSKLRKLKQFYKAKRVVANNNKKTVSVIKKKKEIPKQKKVAKAINVSPNVSTEDVPAENYSDDNEINENVDDFDRSDDNILISNKFENINTAKAEAKDKDEKLVAIGSGKTLIPKDKFRKIKWNSYTVATRGLLLAAFPRRVLATHSMTGKRSPAFLNKPAKMCLDPKKVADIIIEVMDRFKIRENLIRSVITTKCADESKMFKMRMQKKEREAKAKEQQNTKNKPTVAA
ncbi:hypothetical protein ABMA28_005283 [Loxostege sticticalis]|uniref:BEN domain-containing protein n=1 Tax=Loxostege sticticalis TaxID=481309 RepID=A0ABD0SQP7_LOXSC